MGILTPFKRAARAVGLTTKKRRSKKKAKKAKRRTPPRTSTGRFRKRKKK